eukprot:9654292-Karenia_brevis.AAC.1
MSPLHIVWRTCLLLALPSLADQAWLAIEDTANYDGRHMTFMHSSSIQSGHDQRPSWPTAQHAMRCKKLNPTDA